MSSGICPRCGRANQCAFSLDLPPEQCWCMSTINTATKKSEKQLMPVPVVAADCYCPGCLAEIKEQEKTRKQYSQGIKPG